MYILEIWGLKVVFDLFIIICSSIISIIYYCQDLLYSLGCPQIYDPPASAT